MIQQLNLATLKDELDGGRVGAAFDHELRRCVEDCQDRPGDTKPRKVTLELTIEPVKSDSNFCEEVWGKIRISSTVPKRQTKPISFGVRKGGMLVFNDLSEDDVKQRTID